ncbi:MAG: TrbI/VirB10 family protein [Novosphingobium sp.]
MRLNRRLPKHIDAANDRDPREGMSAEIIDLTTRNVLPTVTQRKPRSDGLGLAAGVALVGLLGAATLWNLNSSRQVNPPAQTVTAPVPARVDAAPPVPLQAITPAPAAPPQQAVYAAPPQRAPALAPGLNPHASPTVVFDSSALPTALIAPSVPIGSTAPNGGTGNGNDDFSSRVGGVGGGPATATQMIEPKTTVTQGTLIPAVLETAIDTDVPGYVRAIVSADVRSFDGTRVLVPRSSRLIGQYKSGLQAGQKRAYVIWTRLIRPDGVSVNIASPAVAFSGETGLAGKVNSHFFARFGSAMLLSVITGLSSVGNNAALMLGGQSAAAAAVGQSGQIGPTVRVRQGQPIRVFTARDLDFSKVTTE